MPGRTGTATKQRGLAGKTKAWKMQRSRRIEGTRIRKTRCRMLQAGTGDVTKANEGTITK